ncbi:MAG: transcriptional repressor NrdR [Oscillospiraceae bacterium]|nr:transcriptional repressor NrdR [Oscillospiraceae bacterium]
MKCPFCGFSESKVVDSRPADDGEKIRRRRECLSCSKRFTTYEIIESTPLLVIKKDGSIEQYDRSKLLRGILKSCEKRPVSYEAVEQIVNKVEGHLNSDFDKEVPSHEIGSYVMDYLRELDEVSYVRFASVYREFKDINTFMNELSKLMSERNKK